MLATFLVEYPWLVPTAFLVFALASPFLGALLAWAALALRQWWDSAHRPTTAASSEEP